jgi:hypothetical protein
MDQVQKNPALWQETIPSRSDIQSTMPDMQYDSDPHHLKCKFAWLHVYQSFQCFKSVVHFKASNLKKLATVTGWKKMMGNSKNVPSGYLT